MKTILITCIRGYIARNILATDVFLRLRERGDLRIVVVAPAQNVPSLTEEFGGERVIFEGIDLPAKEIPNGIDRVLWTAATNLLDTATRRVQRRVKFAADGNWLDFAASALVGFLGMFRPVRSTYRAIAAVLSPGREFEYLFERYGPDLLFATDIYALEDVKLMRAAKRWGVKTVGMVRSWDNVTSKTLLTHIPDEVVVNGPRIREELVRYGDVPAGRIFVTGVPHYDRYRPELCLSRRDFMKNYGLQEDDKLVLLATPSDVYMTGNPVTPVAIEALQGTGVKVLVRLPLVGKAEMENQNIGPLPANVILDDPGTYPNFTDAHFTRAADEHLANCLSASDVVITWASTLIIDAAVFNKPVILIGFDASLRPYHQSIARFYDYDHHQPILRLGAARLARSPEELRRWVEGYLEDPRLDEAARLKVVAEHCGPTDGRSGQRLGEFLLGKLGIR